MYCFGSKFRVNRNKIAIIYTFERRIIMNNKLIAIDSEGNKRQINILFVFNENNGKDYLFFTEDESKDESNEVLVKRYVNSIRGPFPPNASQASSKVL